MSYTGSTNALGAFRLGSIPSTPTERSEGGSEAGKLLYLRWELKPGAMREFFVESEKASAARAGLKEISVRKFTERNSQHPDSFRKFWRVKERTILGSILNTIMDKLCGSETTACLAKELKGDLMF